MAGLAMRATARRWRGLGVGVGLGCGFGRRPGGLRQQENIPEVAQRLARGMPQAVIAYLVEAGRQDVLEEAPDELVAGHGLLALAVGGAVRGSREFLRARTRVECLRIGRHARFRSPARVSPFERTHSYCGSALSIGSRAVAFMGVRAHNRPHNRTG